MTVTSTATEDDRNVGSMAGLAPGCSEVRGSLAVGVLDVDIDLEVHLSGQEVIFSSLLVAEGVTPGPGVGDMPAALDMVEPRWVRLELEATDEPSTFIYRAGVGARNPVAGFMRRFRTR